MNATDELQAIDEWRELLGEDFPAMSQSDLGLKVSDYSHAESFDDRGWRVAYDHRFSVKVTATVQRGRFSKQRPIPEEHLIFASNKLKFTAHVVAPIHVDVWWQVANTGQHARSSNGLRGQIFRAKLLSGKDSPQRTVNWEDTSFTGVHLIRAVLVRDSAVVGHSEWRRVNVYSRGHHFSE
jgi:hypothetical protein